MLAGPTQVSGDINTDQTWSLAGSPYVLTGSVYVRDGATVTVEPGVVVKFARTGGIVNTASLRVVSGRLVARGTASSPIVFTSLYDDSVAGDTDGGTGVPQPGDWATISIDAETAEGAAETAPSVIANTYIRYGGSGGSTNCPSGSAVSVGSWGRLRLSKSEIAYAYAAGVSVAALENGIGSATVSNVGVTQSGCGFFPRAGTFTNNYVDQTVSLSFWANQPTDVTMSGNWFVNPADSRGFPAPTTETFDFRFNAVPNGFVGVPSSQKADDLSYNWWGGEPTQEGSCHVNGDREVPAVGIVAWTAASGCPWPNPVHGEYFTDIKPLLDVPPAVPQTGPGADPNAPAAVPWERMFGGLGSSEYAYPAQGSMADPVATATGAYVEERVDASVPAPRLSLTAARTYNSADPSVGWLGQGWHFGYEAWLNVSQDGSVVVLHAEDGQQVRYERQADGSYRGGPGVTARLARDGDEWLLTTRAQLDRRFGPGGRLRAITEANGNIVWLNYDGAGQLDSVVASGRSLTFDHNAAGRIIRVMLDDGRYVGYGYTAGMLTSVRDLAGRTTSYGYDAQGRLISKMNNAGHEVMRLAYHPTSGRVSDQWDVLDNHTQFGWDAVTGTATMTDPRGKIWTDRYEGNLLMARTAPDGATTTFTYDADLQLIETNGPRGVVNEFSYNTAGDLVSTTTPTGTVTTVYDQRHRPIESVNARGTHVEYRYDGADNMTKIIRPQPGNPSGTLETAFGYSNRGMLLSTTDARGKTSTNTYTPAGDLESSTSPSGAKTSYSYDLTGRLTAIVDPRGNQQGATRADFTSSYVWADDDQPEEVIDPLGRSTSYTYDSLGRTTSVTDAKNRTTTYTYDRSSRVTSVQGPDPAIAATTYAYDANSNLTSQTDAAGRTVTYEYDAVNRIAKATTPLGSHTYTHDKAGNLKKVTDPAGNTTAMTYDAANRVIGIDYPAGTTDVTYRWDANGNRTKMIDAAGTVTYSYDKLDRLTTVTRASSIFRFGYDAVGGINKMTYPDGTVYDYTFDDDHRLDTVRQGITTLADYNYDPAGLPATLTRGNATTATYTHDAAGQLTRVRDIGGASATPLLLDETYSYDATGNLTAINGSAGQRVFDYDTLDRLTAACYDTNSCTGATDYVRWAYDNAGNRTSETRPTGTTTYTYAPTTGLLSSTTGPGGTTSYAYDTLGQLKTQTPATGGATTYAYNAAGRVTSEAIAGGATTAYTYDGDGRRLTSTTGNTSTGFVWNPLSYQLASETAGGNTLRRYAYGIGALGVQRPNQTGTDFYHLDRMGSVRAVTNPSAAAQWANEWEPYGLPRTTTKIDPNAATNPIGWTGQYADPTGSVHLRARQYDPALGRFTAPDQAAAMPYSATAAYAASNPLTYTDPTGLWPTWGQVWNGVTTGAAIVAPIALGAGLVVSGPVIVPVLGGIALTAGAITAIDSAHDAYQVCSGNEKGSCLGEVALGAVGIAAGGWGQTAIRRALAARTAARTLPEVNPNATVRDLLDIAPGNAREPFKSSLASRRSDSELLDSVLRPRDGTHMTVSRDGALLEGNHRRFELLDRVADPDSSIDWDTPIFLDGSPR